MKLILTEEGKFSYEDTLKWINKVILALQEKNEEFKSRLDNSKRRVIKKILIFYE